MATAPDLEPLYTMLDRFWRGADRSERLAQRIVAWLESHVPDDSRFADLVGGLQQYRTKTGQEGATALCRAAMELIRPPTPPPFCPACGERALTMLGFALFRAPPGTSSERDTVCYRQYECPGCGTHVQRTGPTAAWVPW